MSRFALESVTLASLNRRRPVETDRSDGGSASSVLLQAPLSVRTGGSSGQPRRRPLVHHIAVEQNSAGYRAWPLRAEYEHLTAESGELCRPGQADIDRTLLTVSGLVRDVFGDAGATHFVADLRQLRQRVRGCHTARGGE